MSQPEIALSPADLAALVELAPEPAEAGRAQRRLGRICRPVANAPRLPVQG